MPTRGSPTSGVVDTGPSASVVMGGNSGSSAAVASLGLLYATFVLLRAAFPIRDGVVDLFFVGMLLGVSISNPRRLVANAGFLGRTHIPSLAALAIFYVAFLSAYSGSSLATAAAELLGPGKWLIYFMLGVLVGPEVVEAPRPHLLTPALVLVGLAVVSYDWGDLFRAGVITWEGFYLNSFAGPFQLRSVFALFALILCWYGLRSGGKYERRLLVALGLVGLLMSGNRKSLIALLLAMFFLRPPRRVARMFGILRVPLLVVGLLALGLSPIGRRTIAEYGRVEQPRVFLYYGAGRIAADYFPIGPGPGTFATRSSMTNYSDLYARYNFKGKWGFNPEDDVQFFGDTYWAPLIGQFGVVGLLLALGACAAVMRRLRELDRSVPEVVPRWAVFLVLIVLSTVTPYLQRTEAGLFVFLPFGIEYRIWSRRRFAAGIGAG